MAPHLRIKDMAASERPRERLFEKGPDALTAAEHIAILLRTGTPEHSAVEIGQKLLNRFGTLDNLCKASVAELRQVKGVGRDKAVTLKSAFHLADMLVKEKLGESPLLDTPERVAEYLREKVRKEDTETLWALILNTRRRLVRCETISNGTLDSLLVRPAEVFRTAIALNASALIIVHNHPSGDPAPSESDIRITRDLIRAGQLLKIEVLDHVILGRPIEDQRKEYYSLREMGYFYT